MSVTPPTLPYQPKGSRRWLPVCVGIAASVIAFLFGASILWQFIDQPSNYNWHRLRCHSHLNQIGQAIRFYTDENGGHYPPEFRLLWTTQDLLFETLVCPSTGKSRPTTLASAATFASDSDYIYLGAGLTIRGHPDIVVAHDRPSNHGDVVNVLFADGRVEQLPVANFPQLLSKSAALRTPTSRPAK